ncbi:MAG TPA: serine/threonine-protein kinase [Kofleriaceae bacterium]|nr:serine/threonine-protein kinase [Kofleriaceae bacterium]
MTGVGGATGSRPRGEAREETESIPLPAEWDAGDDEDDALDDEPGLPPLSAAPMGTHDRPPTRVESPVARRPPSGARGPRTPHPPPPPPPATEHPEDRIGHTLGAYRLHALIGKGGMGFVYRAEHVRLGREVALKLLRSDYSRRRDSVSRFFQEARTVNRIRHRNIVDVTDFVELEDGTTYIIMELLRGQSLGSWSRHSFDLPRALGLLIQICDGLAAAHAVGVIHRDLKPDNVVVMPTGDGAETIKLLDFGVAKLLNRDDEDVGLETAAGSVIGTPAYMSPEQAGGLPIDERADIYSLGAIMYELFCGQPLFRGRSFGEYVRKHLNEAPHPPRQTPRGATLDPRLEEIILRCLEKEPDRRNQSVAELRQELIELLATFETADAPPAAVRRASGQLPAAMPGAGHASGRRPPPPFATTTPPPGAHSAPLPVPPPPIDLSLAASLSGEARSLTPYPGDPALAASLLRLDPTLVPRSRRRLWLAAMATVAAGIGVAGALVAAARHRDEEPEARAAQPANVTPPAPPLVTGATTGSAEAQPAAPAAPPPPTAPALVEVRIDAPAGAHVLRASSGVELCVAPCNLAIDPTDGDAADRRDYTVRLDGHADQTIAIDLAAPPPSIAVHFDDAAAPPVDDDVPAADDRPTAGTGRRHSLRGNSPPRSPQAPEPPQPPATDNPPPPPPPPTVKQHQTVDPTDTIDPFANEK